MGYFDKFSKPPYKGKGTFGKFWHFIWHEDSLESWVLNILLAYVLIRFLVYPGLGVVFGTSHPIVAVVSDSMHHGVNFDEYWQNGGAWYEQNGISRDEFRGFKLHNGFERGDIIMLIGTTVDKSEVGDIIIFRSNRPDPIIHRVVTKNPIDGIGSLQTKGDNNPIPIFTPRLNELDIRNGQLIGKAFIRVPYLGFIKIWAVEFACLFGDFPFCIA